MKKIEKLFKEYPELKVLERWVIKTLNSREFHPLKNVYKRFCVKKPKFLDKKLKVLKNSQSTLLEKVHANMYIEFYYWGSALFGFLNKCFLILKNDTPRPKGRGINGRGINRCED